MWTMTSMLCRRDSMTLLSLYDQEVFHEDTKIPLQVRWSYDDLDKSSSIVFIS